jgi:hypothetical protein
LGRLRARGQVAAGEDPAAAKPPKSAAPTVGDLADRYLDEHASLHKKSRSIEEDRRNLRKHVLPAIGSRRAADVTRQEVLKLHHALRATPGAANRIVALLSMMFSPDHQLDAAAKAIQQMRVVKQSYADKLAAASSSDSEAIDAPIKAVTDQGLSVHEYNAIIAIGRGPTRRCGRSWSHASARRRNSRMERSAGHLRLPK